jgi:tRNA (Thr-GGU) A37 N-methylase
MHVHPPTHPSPFQVIFSFHQNTNTVKANDGSGAHGKHTPKLVVKAKVRPPRCPTGKVGLFATRTPHRPNNLGLTVLKVESVDVKAGE